MFKVKNNTAPNIFKSQFSLTQHNYPTRSTMLDFSRSNTLKKTSRFSILNRREATLGTLGHQIFSLK